MLTSLLASVLLLQTTQPVQHDLILRNARVYDGTGNAWYDADVAVDGKRISAIGDLSAAHAKREIDIRRRALAPGFIDVHTHVDDDIHQYPLAENFIRDGVTTIVSGNCGGSVLDVGTFFDRIAREGSAVNNATLIGHNAVLRKVKGGSVAGKLTDEQMNAAKGLVDAAMKDGAVGFSTGLIYTPGTWSDTEEIIELMKVAASYGGIYATHMRSESGEIKSAIEEALRIGREANCRVEISHFKMPIDTATKFGRGQTIDAGSDITLAMVEAARKNGQEVWLDQYPYTASSTTMSTLLPDWVLEKGGDEASKILRDPDQVKKILSEMRQLHEVTRLRKDMSFAVVTTAQNHPEYAGMSIKQIAQMKKFWKENPAGTELLAPASTRPATAPVKKTGNPWDFVEVTMEDQYRAVIDLYLDGGAGGVFHTMDETEVKNILAHPLVGVASDSGVRVFGSGMPHPRGYGTNARVLGRYVRELKVITLEDAVRKMTSQPATAFRMADRGTIRVGAFADLVIFDPDAVIDQSTFDQPHQYPLGIETVIVNGTVVFEDGKMTGARPGEVIYGPGKRN